jgi:hypothetical protein
VDDTTKVPATYPESESEYEYDSDEEQSSASKWYTSSPCASARPSYFSTGSRDSRDSSGQPAEEDRKNTALDVGKRYFHPVPTKQAQQQGSPDRQPRRTSPRAVPNSEDVPNSRRLEPRRTTPTEKASVPALSLPQCQLKIAKPTLSHSVPKSLPLGPQTPIQNLFLSLPAEDKRDKVLLSEVTQASNQQNKLPAQQSASDQSSKIALSQVTSSHNPGIVSSQTTTMASTQPSSQETSPQVAKSTGAINLEIIDPFEVLDRENDTLARRKPAPAKLPTTGNLKTVLVTGQKQLDGNEAPKLQAAKRKLSPVNPARRASSKRPRMETVSRAGEPTVNITMSGSMGHRREPSTLVDPGATPRRAAGSSTTSAATKSAPKAQGGVSTVALNVLLGPQLQGVNTTTLSPTVQYLLSCPKQREMPELWQGLFDKSDFEKGTDFMALLFYLAGSEGVCGQCTPEKLSDAYTFFRECVGAPKGAPSFVIDEIGSSRCTLCHVEGISKAECAFNLIPHTPSSLNDESSSWTGVASTRSGLSPAVGHSLTSQPPPPAARSPLLERESQHGPPTSLTQSHDGQSGADSPMPGCTTVSDHSMMPAGLTKDLAISPSPARVAQLQHPRPQNNDYPAQKGRVQGELDGLIEVAERADAVCSDIIYSSGDLRVPTELSQSSMVHRISLQPNEQHIFEGFLDSTRCIWVVAGVCRGYLQVVSTTDGITGAVQTPEVSGGRVQANECFRIDVGKIVKVRSMFNGPCYLLINIIVEAPTGLGGSAHGGPQGHKARNHMLL